MSRSYKYQDLPVPRLELRWEESQEAARFPSHRSFVCTYEMVLPVNRYDVRNQDRSGIVRVKLGETKSSRANAPDYIKIDGIDTPFRDGVHAACDSARLRLPAFATYNGFGTFVEPSHKRDEED